VRVPTVVEQFRHQVVRAFVGTDDAQGFVSRQDGGEPLGLVGTQRVNVHQVLMEHLAVGEQQRAEGLRLRGGGYVFFSGQVGQEGPHFGAAHVMRWRLSWNRM
jgi:hypothetical protein